MVQGRHRGWAIKVKDYSYTRNGKTVHVGPGKRGRPRRTNPVRQGLVLKTGPIRKRGERYNFPVMSIHGDVYIRYFPTYKDAIRVRRALLGKR